MESSVTLDIVEPGSNVVEQKRSINIHNGIACKELAQNVEGNSRSCDQSQVD